MTVDEFLAWAEGQEGRHELFNGQVYAMAPERSAQASQNSRFRQRWQTESAALGCPV